MTSKNILAFSGGKDSTCLAHKLAEDGEPFELFFTPTGNELPECLEHIANTAARIRRKLVVKTAGKSLLTLIREQRALPNNRQRWCTWMLKIEVCKAYLLEHPGSTLLVGLRADEEHREGMWGEYANYRYPLRDLGWGIKQVWGYLDSKGVTIPARTDCAWCYAQRLSEWWKLWKEHPDLYAKGEELEELTGHTFRSPSRDTWPASLKELRLRFEAGDVPKGIISLPLFGCYGEPVRDRCRVCSL